MTTTFRIGVSTDEEILASPPAEFLNVNHIFTPFAVRVGQLDYPTPFWTDFAGVILFKWYRAVLKLASGESGTAHLPFWYTYEMWLQQAPRQQWRLSLVQRQNDDKTILHKAVVIPEVMEAALLTAIQNLLEGARSAGVWTEDCIALDALLKGREAYLADLEAGRTPLPTFLSGSGPSPSWRDKPAWEMPFGSFLARNADHRSSPTAWDLPTSIARNSSSPSLPCPHCGAVIKPGCEQQMRQGCPLCGCAS